MSAKPLSAKEKQWISDLQAVLDKCPSSRLGFFTTGDSTVTVVDLPVTNAWEDKNGTDQDYCIAVMHAKSELGTLTFPADVQSTAG